MADVPSQARFLGGLALVLMAVALAFVLFVLVSANVAPPPPV